MTRPHSTRIQANLDDIRRELVNNVSPIPDSDLGWAPAAGMKSYRDILQEIGVMEKLCAHWIATGDLLDWNPPAFIPAETCANALAELEAIRTETSKYLTNVTEETLQTQIPVPPSWQQYMGKEIEPEEVVRWIAQHEYYHLGQIISYRWSQGHSPI